MTPSRAYRKQARDLLRRLKRLVRMRIGYRDDLNPIGLRLLDRAIRATCGDCADFGEAEAAGELLYQLSYALRARGAAL